MCDHRISLAKAQEEIVANWVKLARHVVSVPQPPNAPAARCSASASWNSQYDDYDVYIHSNQPDRDAIVTGAGRTASYYTNSSGYADVYFYASRSDAGDTINVQVGSARCSTTL